MRYLSMSLMLALAATLALATPPQHSVQLASGKTIKGQLVRITPGSYLLQSGAELLELGEDEIQTVDGRKGDLSAATKPENLRSLHKYEEVRSDGSVLAWDSFDISNPGPQALTEVSFGIAPHEAEGALAVEYLDGFGNRLKTKLEPGLAENPKAKRRMLTIALAVPVAPGESARLTSRRAQGGVRKTAEGLSLSFAGDFPDDRLVWRKVRLPKGAQILRTDPAPTARFDHDGTPYLMWRRLYWQGEVAPTTVVYRLP
ncbi:MAG: hypothetical protein WC326_12045 [Candidatus Delongbacteria bacterium]